MGELEQQGHDLVGDFAGADDLLWAAHTGELARMGPVRVARSARIGPLVEILLARSRTPDLFATVTSKRRLR